ncbi:MAG: hypothetical protein LBB36_01010 [Fibromonadaceae bacterium]|jgi:tetratricopeptide (TPR) repeat protein|nr:hypothetical protein [Fibromonadaceae bacterium]
MITFAEYNARLCDKDLQEFFQYLLLAREESPQDETVKNTIAELQGITISGKLDGRTIIDLREQNEIAANLAEQGKIEESLNAIQQILEIYPEHYSAFYTLGVISFGLGNHNEAMERFKEAFEFNPFFVDAVLRIYDCSVCLGNRDEVSGFLDKALTLQPTDPELLETKKHLENGTYPERISRHLNKGKEVEKPEKDTEKVDLKQNLMKLREMIESGNSEDALEKIREMV